MRVVLCMTIHGHPSLPDVAAVVAGVRLRKSKKLHFVKRRACTGTGRKILLGRLQSDTPHTKRREKRKKRKKDEKLTSSVVEVTISLAVL